MNEFADSREREPVRNALAVRKRTNIMKKHMFTKREVIRVTGCAPGGMDADRKETGDQGREITYSENFRLSESPP